MTLSINWTEVLRSNPPSPASPTTGRSAAAGTRLAEINWAQIFGSTSSSDCDVCPPPSTPRAAAEGPESSPPAKRGRSEDPARAPSDGGRRPIRWLELEVPRVRKRVQVELRDGPRPLTRAAAKAPAARGFYARSAAETVVDFDGEDECGDENVALKHCLKSFPRLDGSNNLGKADDVGERGAPQAEKKDDKEPAPPEEIFQIVASIFRSKYHASKQSLRGIPGLVRDNLLRAYSMLIRDDRQFRSLVALPKNMRKDWLLIEMGNQ